MNQLSIFLLKTFKLIVTLIAQDESFFKKGWEYGMFKFLLKVNCRIFGSVHCFGLIEPIRM